MTRLESLEQEIRRLYKEKNPARADWADWLYENHVFVVGDHAKQLAERFNVDSELCQAAAMLHDIADSFMSRFDEEHENESLRMARKLLTKTDYTEEEIKIIVDDACTLHSCRDGDPLPQTDVGRILATADALAHIVDDKFYSFFKEHFEKEGRPNNVEVSLKKLDRDYHSKILFDEIKEEQKDNYEKLKAFISL